VIDTLVILEDRRGHKQSVRRNDCGTWSGEPGRRIYQPPHERDRTSSEKGNRTDGAAVEEEKKKAGHQREKVEPPDSGERSRPAGAEKGGRT